MFNIGDKVCHPKHGAGIIEDIEQKEIFGEKQAFYVIHIPLSRMQLTVSTNKAEELGIRVVKNEKEMEGMVGILKGVTTSMSENWSKRYKQNIEKITSGDILEVAQTVKNLYVKDAAKGLSSIEKKLLNNGKQILVSEMILSGNIEKENAEEMVESALLQNEK
ncbi:MAG TPA: CarD family transcriptional regulator [Clostridiales bacterium]|nr:MAG: CarD family transcriptional regulator [Clostridiales bacterium GWD2_32_59]HAN10811.1 CarD family transcriptional regulator [Clostridiales bacterium]